MRQSLTWADVRRSWVINKMIWLVAAGETEWSNMGKHSGSAGDLFGRAEGLFVHGKRLLPSSFFPASIYGSWTKEMLAFPDSLAARDSHMTHSQPMRCKECKGRSPGKDISFFIRKPISLSSLSLSRSHSLSLSHTQKRKIPGQPQPLLLTHSHFALLDGAV